MDQTLTSKLPKHFWIPSRQMFITVNQYMQLYRFCKDNPGLEVKETICNWWGGTTDDVINEIRKGIHERIYLRQFLK
jgi:hypothetical protein